METLTPREIIELLKEGKKVKLSLPKEELRKLLANLRVLKSRDNKLLAEYGMQIEHVVVNCTQEPEVRGQVEAVISMQKPTKEPKYSVFVVEEQEIKGAQGEPSANPE